MTSTGGKDRTRVIMWVYILSLASVLGLGSTAVIYKYVQERNLPRIDMQKFREQRLLDEKNLLDLHKKAKEEIRRRRIESLKKAPGSKIACNTRINTERG